MVSKAERAHSVIRSEAAWLRDLWKFNPFGARGEDAKDAHMMEWTFNQTPCGRRAKKNGAFEMRALWVPPEHAGAGHGLWNLAPSVPVNLLRHGGLAAVKQRGGGEG
ncbi:hypothetical protein NDU88_004946 [Pleurodeles waltl]|uniref:Uncharacterized protein n=1 Tax=Pleurodeles waltl TaxID=8319 RepID=A0AAV7MUY0_PLEWA|nr:hypothetical protein NDU88_004946 [Pleurodeles waltl]